MRFFIVCVYLLASGSAYCQQQTYVPPSPNAAAMARFANIQVGHYTGIPNIAIPFGELPGKEISIPISLQYHASGIKVQDVASSAGLGWNLNAGGAITRVVQGIPDGIENMCSDTSQNRYNNNALGGCDGERDIFFFSFLGRNVKMFLDANGIPQTMPYQDIKIDNPDLADPTGGWIITDEAGYKYYFGNNEASRETTTYFTTVNSVYTERYTFVSTWYLNKVVSPSGLDVATFLYSSGNQVEYMYYSQQVIGISVTNYNTKLRINQPKYISNITTALGSVLFNYTTNRIDLSNGWHLNSISFRDLNGVIKRKFYLVHDYFICNATTQGNPGAITEPCRLKLTAIQEGVNTPIQVFSFGYNEEQFMNRNANPKRESYFEDYYGYYNLGVNQNAGFSNRADRFCNTFGMNKSSFSSTKVFSLSEIHNSTGGKTVFDYAVSRGLRITSIANYAGEELVSKSTFTYSAAEGVVTPVLSYITHDNKTVCNSSSFRELFDLNGVAAGYSSVTETFLDGSKVVRHFTNFTDYPDVQPTVEKWKQTMGNNPSLLSSMQDPNGPPFSPSTSKYYIRGLSKMLRIYDNQNNLLSKDTMTYSLGSLAGSVENVGYIFTSKHKIKVIRPYIHIWSGNTPSNHDR